VVTRDDRLREIGLWPRWTLRAQPRAAQVTAAGDGDGPPAADQAAEDGLSRVASVSTPGTTQAPAREARIATLDWERFGADVDACIACGLCRSRQRSVPGVGDVHAAWLFVGEAPGAEEDAQGEPFVGQAGKLLDSMLRALGLARGAGVYIANVLKCRPPNNRAPTPAEAAACRPYLDRQIELIAPGIVVALGKSAANTLLDNDATIGSLRGKVHAYRGIPLVVTYHPAYLLRTLQDKAKSWEDLLLARRTLRAADPAARGATGNPA